VQGETGKMRIRLGAHRIKDARPNSQKFSNLLVKWEKKKGVSVEGTRMRGAAPSKKSKKIKVSTTPEHVDRGGELLVSREGRAKRG